MQPVTDIISSLYELKAQVNVKIDNDREMAQLE